jgi:hypothetical protein
MADSPHGYRSQTNRWYSSRRWKKRRAEQLKAEPLCWMCREEGKATAATVADHDPPHRGDEQKFWFGKLRSLCKRHHDSDKALIEHGKSRVVIDLDGWPVIDRPLKTLRN